MKRQLLSGPPMPRELPARFGWQDDDEVVLYDDNANEIS